MLVKPIVLVGLMGTGKTVTGRDLGSKLALPFSDTDVMIEIQESMPITRIFSEKGEAHFRASEMRCLKKIDWSCPQIISTGGGLFASPENQAYIQSRAYVIWLHVAPERLINRLVHETTGRPLLQHADWRERLVALAKEREEHYRKAHWTCTVTAEPVSRVARQIIDHLREKKILHTDVLSPTRSSPHPATPALLYKVG